MLSMTVNSINELKLNFIFFLNDYPEEYALNTHVVSPINRMLQIFSVIFTNKIHRN